MKTGAMKTETTTRGTETVTATGNVIPVMMTEEMAVMTDATAVTEIPVKENLLREIILPSDRIFRCMDVVTDVMTDVIIGTTTITTDVIETAKPVAAKQSNRVKNGKAELTSINSALAFL